MNRENIPHTYAGAFTPGEPDTRPARGELNERVATLHMRQACALVVQAIEALDEHTGNATLVYPDDEDLKAFAKDANKAHSRALKMSAGLDKENLGQLCETLAWLAEYADTAQYAADQAWSIAG